MKTIFIIIVLTFLFLSCTEPKSNIVIDGILQPNEWPMENKIRIDNKNILFLTESKDHFFLAVKSDLPKPFYIDLFFEIKNTTYNVHASSQLGDRILKNNDWDDYKPETKWGENKGWTANTVNFEKNEEGEYTDSFIPYDGFELQFDKKQWQLNNSKFRIEIRNMVGPQGFQALVFPADSKRKDHTKWHQINL